MKITLTAILALASGIAALPEPQVPGGLPGAGGAGGVTIPGAGGAGGGFPAAPIPKRQSQICIPGCAASAPLCVDPSVSSSRPSPLAVCIAQALGERPQNHCARIGTDTLVTS